MRPLFLLLSIFSFSPLFSQWTRVPQLPSSNIFSLFHKDNALYAGGTNVIYISKNKGQTWTTTTTIPGLSPVTSIIDNIIVYKNELYASTPKSGIFKSSDDGITWQSINTGIPDLVIVTDFCEYKGDVYACTVGSFANSIFKLDPVSKSQWLSFSDGLGSISSVLISITGTSNTLIAGSNNNGLYDYLAPNSGTWEERILTSSVNVNEGAFDIITGHDTLFYAGKTGKFFMSVDNGLTWNIFGSRLVTGATFIANAKEALISSRYIFDGSNNTVQFYYIKKDSLQFPFRNFSVVPGHFTWRIDILDGKLWDASDQGLFFMSLSDLPGITDPNDTVNTVVLPIHFISAEAMCDASQTLITWKTAQEQNSSRFGIERTDGTNQWSEIGSVPAKGIGGKETAYSFIDSHPLAAAHYRIVEYDLNGHVQYSAVFRSICAAINVMTVWPNPVQSLMSISIISSNRSQVLLKLFDSRASLVKVQSANLSVGTNQFTMDVRALTSGVYHLVVDDQLYKTIQVLR